MFINIKFIYIKFIYIKFIGQLFHVLSMNVM